MQLTNSTVISQGNSLMQNEKRKKSHCLNLSENDGNRTQYGLVIRSAKSSAGDLHSGHLINKGSPGSDSI